MALHGLLLTSMLLVTGSWAQISEGMYKSDRTGQKPVPDFLLAAVLPLTKSCDNGGEIDPEGIAIVEALDFAINEVKKLDNTTFKGVDIGFQARDDCNSVAKTKSLAYDLVKPPLPDLVLSEFRKDNIKSIKIFANEKVPQMSYVPDNALLAKDDSVTAEDIKLLTSAAPEETRKMEAVASLIEDKFNFDHVYMIGSADKHGREGLKLLGQLLDNNVCADELLFDGSAESMAAIVATLKKNPLIRGVVLHLSGDLELEIFKEFNKLNMTDCIFISTQNWKNRRGKLAQYDDVVEGMIFVNLEATTSTTYGVHIGAQDIPFAKKPWLQEMFVKLGGTKGNCKTDKCNNAEQLLQAELHKFKPVATIIIDAVFAIAHALKNQGSSSFLESLSKVNYQNKITLNKVIYKGRYLLSNNYELHQMQGLGDEFTSKVVGEWQREEIPNLTEESEYRFKKGVEELPLSACSPQCPPSEYRNYEDSNDACCWACTTCPDGLVTNISNADTCISCGRGFTSLPNQTACVSYNLVFFHWFSAMGQFMIFMIVLGICLTLFSLGIVSQNSEHIVVKLGGYKLISWYLFGCAMMMMAPVAILVEPTITTCSSFIGVFNMAITIPLAVLISKSALITETLFDSEGDLVKGTLGRRPRAIVCLIGIIIQLVIIIVGALLDPPIIRHTDSDRWDWKYAVCANSKSTPFWASFFYNVFLGVLCNVLSCNAKRINDNFGELRNVCVTTLWYFLCCVIHAILIFKLDNMALLEGQALVCIIYGLFFLIGFILPKVYIILFKSINEEDELAEANAEDADKDSKKSKDSSKGD
jgi:hypothetical protein